METDHVIRSSMGRIKHLLILPIVLLVSISGFAQTEVLTNAKIIEMTKAGLTAEVILVKIKTSIDRFDISSDALIELKKAGVEDGIIATIVEIGRAVPISSEPSGQTGNLPLATSPQTSVSARGSLLTARTIAIQKSSVNPSRQALEKELLKREDWRSLNLTIEQYKDNADLYIDIGFVPLSLVTHRYVFRIYDRRTGAVIAAGETTSWGSLPEHLAKHICESLIKIKTSAQGSVG